MIQSEQLGTNSVRARHVVSGNLKRKEMLVDIGTVQTTGNTDAYFIAPVTGTLSSVLFSGADNLAANDTNYVTFSMTNLGQGGAGSTAMLTAGDINTTKATGGSAIVVNAVRALTVNSGNATVQQGDRIRIRAAATGTLANTVTFANALGVFTFTA